MIPSKWVRYMYIRYMSPLLVRVLVYMGTVRSDSQPSATRSGLACGAPTYCSLLYVRRVLVVPTACYPFEYIHWESAQAVRRFP